MSIFLEDDFIFKQGTPEISLVNRHLKKERIHENIWGMCIIGGKKTMCKESSQESSFKRKERKLYDYRWMIVRASAKGWSGDQRANEMLHHDVPCRQV